MKTQPKSWSPYFWPSSIFISKTSFIETSSLETSSLKIWMTFQLWSSLTLAWLRRSIKKTLTSLMSIAEHSSTSLLSRQFSTDTESQPTFLQLGWRCMSFWKAIIRFGTEGLVRMAILTESDLSMLTNSFINPKRTFHEWLKACLRSSVKQSLVTDTTLTLH